jgi:ribosomal protein S2
MKIKKIEQHSTKLMKLKILQTKIYDKKQYLTNNKIEDIEYRLKKIFYIVYKYHIFNKRILFVGLPSTMNSKITNLLKSSKHISIPENIWVRGAISNKKACFKHISKHNKTSSTKISELIFQLKKSIDLVIFFEKSANPDVLNESYISRIPVISISNNLDIQNVKASYKVSGNFHFDNKKVLDNFFYSLLFATLKKGNLHRRYLKKIQKTSPYNIFNKTKAKHVFKKKK